jgi:hypothetical protein
LKKIGEILINFDDFITVVQNDNGENNLYEKYIQI